MKKETRGRKPNRHEPVKASFEDVIKAIGKSSYKDEKAIKKTKQTKSGRTK